MTIDLQDIKEKLSLLLDNFIENTKDKEGIDIDTEKINIIDEFANELHEEIEDYISETKEDFKAEIVDKIDDLSYAVNNL